MTRHQKIISDANYFLSFKGECPGIRRFVKRASGKARRSLSKIETRKALVEYQSIGSVYEFQGNIDSEIEELLDSGARPGCGCGCGGGYLADLIEVKKLGLGSIDELVAFREKAIKDAQIDLLWSQYRSA